MSKPDIIQQPVGTEESPADFAKIALNNLENLRLVDFPYDIESSLFHGDVTIEAESVTVEAWMKKNATMTFTNPSVTGGSQPDLENGASPLNLSVQCEALEIQGMDNGEERTVTIADALVTFSGEITWEEPKETDGHDEGNYIQGLDDGKVSFSKEEDKLIFHGPIDLDAASALEGFPVNLSVAQITIDAAVQYGNEWTNTFSETTDSAIENGSIVIEGGRAQYNADSNTLIISGDGVKGHNVVVDLKRNESDIFQTESESLAVRYTPSVSDHSATGASILAYLPFFALIAVLVASLIISFIQIRRLHGKIQKLKRHPDAKKPVTANTSRDISALSAEPASLTVKDIQNIGKRPSQQDCLGCISVQGGAFAVVADGMGGLSDGDKVSQKVVQTMLQDGANRSAAQLSENLLQLVAHANTEVNQMLGYKTYQSGSTLVAVVAERNSFRWVSIGDSRIYLYRAGGLLQMNREHVFKQELLKKAVNRELTFAEAQSPEEGKKVTSFIGMGEIKYIDQCLHPVRALPGDRLMLCSDGVFNALSEREITSILGSYQDAASAAAAMEAAVLSKNEQYQDNFSAVLFFYA